MPGHAGGPAIEGKLTVDTLPSGIEAAMEAAGFTHAHLAGNSLGGWVALQLAARGRALSVTGLAPAGGWSAEFQNQWALDYFITQQDLVKKAAPTPIRSRRPRKAGARRPASSSPTSA